MSRIIRFLFIIAVLCLAAIALFWWNRPKQVDMAGYVPANVLMYLEANSLSDIANAMTDSKVWQHLSSSLDIKSEHRQNEWLRYFIKITGIGSTSAVIATRAQIAFVVFDLGVKGRDDTLSVKPIAAFVVETHTSGTRIKPVVEKLLDDVAHRIYMQPKFERINLEGGEFVRWIAPDGQRRIVASFDGSVAVVGNDEQAVSACLAAHRGKRPNLLQQPELEEMRGHLHANQALAFGYVSSDSTARLAAEIAPMFLGRLLEGSQVQQLLATAASKTLSSIGWSARSFLGGIEDSYFLTLKPGIAARLRPAFVGTDQGVHGVWEFLPPDVYSVTTYRIREPAAAWEEINSAMSARLDTVSAVFFTAGFRSLLTPYGIDDPNTFLKTLKPDVVTVRLSLNSDQALVFSGIADAEGLHQFIAKAFGLKPRLERIADTEVVVSTDERYAASFAGDNFILGSPDDLRACLRARAAHATLAFTAAKLATVTHYREGSNASSVMTLTKDNDNVRAFVASLATLRGSQGAPTSTEIDRFINELPYALTETAIGESGFERRSRSTFGLFGYLVSLAVPEARHQAQE